MSIQAISKRLAAAGVEHVVVANTPDFENDLAKAIFKHKSQKGDVEIDLRETDLASTYTSFVFKPKTFVPFLQDNGVSEAELQDFLKKNKKDIPRDLDIYSDVVGVILVEPDDGDGAFITLNTASGLRAKLAVLREKEELLEDDEDDEYDPETDELEDDD